MIRRARLFWLAIVPVLLLAAAAVIVPTAAVLFVPDVRRMRSDDPLPDRTPTAPRGI